MLNVHKPWALCMSKNIRFVTCPYRLVPIHHLLQPPPQVVQSERTTAINTTAAAATTAATNTLDSGAIFARQSEAPTPAEYRPAALQQPPRLGQGSDKLDSRCHSPRVQHTFVVING